MRVASRAGYPRKPAGGHPRGRPRPRIFSIGAVRPAKNRQCQPAHASRHCAGVIRAPRRSRVLRLLRDDLPPSPGSSCSQDFESLSTGTAVPGWRDTSANNSFSEDDSLFAVTDLSGNRVLSTSSPDVREDQPVRALCPRHQSDLCAANHRRRAAARPVVPLPTRGQTDQQRELDPSQDLVGLDGGTRAVASRQHRWHQQPSDFGNRRRMVDRRGREVLGQPRNPPALDRRVRSHRVAVGAVGPVELRPERASSASGPVDRGPRDARKRTATATESFAT